MSQLRSGALALLLAAGSLTCGENVEPTIATNLEYISGNGQTGAVGTALANALTVAATDASGNAVPGVSVSWAAQGGGTVSSASVTTGSDGRASVNRVLGPTAGEQTTTASVTGLQGSPVTFVDTATEDIPPPGTIEISTNPPVSALTGEVFDPLVQPEVVARDGSGNPVGGAEVTARIASGGGTLEGNVTATTNASGVAKFGDLGIRGIGDHTLEFTAGTASVTSSPVTLSDLPPEATSGKWGPVVNWDIVPLHMSLMPTGKIIAWGKYEAGGTTMAMPRIWDWASGGPPSAAPMIQLDTMLFCAGHTLMPDGRLMVSGGHKEDDKGINVTNFFSPDGVWEGPNTPKMAHGRWYPTVTVLPNGRVLTMAGRDENGNVVTTPEIWEGGQWVELPGAGTLVIPYYPRNFVAPNGLIFMAGERVMSRWFDVDGSGVGGGRGSWSNGPSHIWPYNRDYGTAVMYESGKILYAGGGGDPGWSTPDPKNPANVPTATAEKIDLNQTGAGWQSAGSMSSPRRHLNATILPDGEVLVTGGVSGGGFNDVTTGVRAAEMWNPETNGWTTLASNSVTRAYHSVSLLLPDATVLHGASGDANDPASGGTRAFPRQANHEIFSPPYLFKGAQPTITSVDPAVVSYGGTITVSTPNAAQVTEVRWIRLGSVTHAFDASARANKLQFEASGGNVTVTAPSGPNLAPPGHYLLFILNRNGVPSEGKIVRVQ